MIEVDYRAMKDSQEFVCGPLRIRTNGSPLARGDYIGLHGHNFDHPLLLIRGTLRIQIDGDEGMLTAPAFFNVKAGMRHGLTAMEDGTVFWCAFPHRNAAGEIVRDAAHGTIEAHQ